MRCKVCVITSLVSGDVSLQQQMLSVGEVWEQRPSFGAQRVFPGEASLKRTTCCVRDIILFIYLLITTKIKTGFYLVLEFTP